MTRAAPPPSPIACRMDALTPAERTRRSEVLAILTQRTVEVVETADGISLHLRNAPDTPALAGAFVAYESRCCPFIRFELAVEAERGPVRLSLGGREGVGEFLRQTFRASATRSGTS
jgi:hypothetical protein